MAFDQKTASLTLARWYIIRTYYVALVKKGIGRGIGLAELEKYAEFKHIAIPAGDKFSHDGHENLVPGKSGFEVYPKEIEVVEQVGTAKLPTDKGIIDIVVIPLKAITVGPGRNFVTLADGSQRNIEYVYLSNRRDLESDVHIKNGLKSEDRIRVLRPNPLGGQLRFAPVLSATSLAWDKFHYFCRLLDREARAVFGPNIAQTKGDPSRQAKLLKRFAAIFEQQTEIKATPAEEELVVDASI